MGSRRRNSGRENKRRKHARQRQAQRERSGRDRMMAGDIGPMTHQGRVITPQVIAEMRAADQEHAYQLDEVWERDVLEHNAPWLDDPQLQRKTEELWAGLDHLCPICNGSEKPSPDEPQVFIQPGTYPESNPGDKA